MAKTKVVKSPPTDDDAIMEVITRRPYTRAMAKKDRSKRAQKVTLDTQEKKSQGPRRHKHLPPTPPKARHGATSRRRVDLSVVESNSSSDLSDIKHEPEDGDGDSIMGNADAPRQSLGPSASARSVQVDVWFLAPGDRQGSVQRSVADLEYNIDAWARDAQLLGVQHDDAERGQDLLADLNNAQDVGIEVLQNRQYIDGEMYNPPFLGDAPLDQQFIDNLQDLAAGNQYPGYRPPTQQFIVFNNNFYGAGNPVPNGGAQPPPQPFAAGPYMAPPYYGGIGNQPMDGMAPPLYAQPQPYMVAPAQPFAGAGIMDQYPVGQQIPDPYVAAPDDAQLEFNAMLNRIAEEEALREAAGAREASTAPRASELSVSSTLRSPSPPSIAAALNPRPHNAYQQRPQPRAGPLRYTPASTRQRTAPRATPQPQAGPSRPKTHSETRGSDQESAAADNDDDAQEDVISEAARNYVFGPRIPREQPLPCGRRYQKPDGTWVDEIYNADPLLSLAVMDGRRFPIPNGRAMSWSLRADSTDRTA
ncbi:hypothetical protein C8Q72DRAFT_954550 [Fomitopsis betulina]|nr:hypothetical protein C8Q72DRAFT_954550 [Fomitopsis betulina]